MCGVAPSCLAGGRRGAGASPYACLPNTGAANGRTVSAARGTRPRRGARCPLGTGGTHAHEPAPHRGCRALRRGSRLLAWRPADPALSPAASGRLRSRSLRPTVERRVILAIVLMLIVAVLPSILFPPKKPAGRTVGRSDSTATPEL